MNFDSIREIYPKAYDRFTSWNFINSNEFVKSPSDFKAQDFEWQKGILYNFFDENRIYLEVHISMDKEFYFFIDSQFTGEYFDYRKEAETDGFLKAFEILENKLS